MTSVKKRDPLRWDEVSSRSASRDQHRRPALQYRVARGPIPPTATWCIPPRSTSYRFHVRQRKLLSFSSFPFFSLFCFLVKFSLPKNLVSRFFLLWNFVSSHDRGESTSVTFIYEKSSFFFYFYFYFFFLVEFWSFLSRKSIFIWMGFYCVDKR